MLKSGEVSARIEQRYADLRAQAERERERRVEEARGLDPQIERLQSALSQAFAEAARDALGGKEQAARAAAILRARVEETGREIARRLSALGLPPDYLEPRYACEKCRDTGYVGELRNVPCACREQMKLDLLYDLSGVEKAQATFAAFDETIYPDPAQRDQALAARDICRRYADQFPRNEKPNLILMGQSGLGKTFFLDCIAQRVIERGQTALRATAFRMLDAMRAYHFGENGEGSAFGQMLDAGLLLIDDLGSEPMLRNITVEYLFVLLNERAAARRHTVLATNLSPVELKERYTERVLSRLMDRSLATHIRLTGRDLRYRGVNA